MAFALARCLACGTARHPPRLLCPACGAGTWATEPCPGGTLEECTTVTGAEPVVLASIRCTAGPVVIAALTAPLPPGTPVWLDPGPGQALLAHPAGDGRRATSSSSALASGCERS